MACGKYGYDKRTAETVRNRRRREGVKYLRLYQCPTCGKWHLTKQPKNPTV